MTAALGKLYEDGEVLIRQGESGDCMFVIQEGQVEVVHERDGRETHLRLVGEGEFVGEMAIFERDVRSATVRAVGRVRALTIDKKNLLRQINEDPSMAFRLVQVMSRRIRDMSAELARLKNST